MLIESGLHRFLGFYTALPKLLQRAGVSLDDLLYWEDELEIRTPTGRSAVFGMSLFKPFKTFSSLLGNNDFLSISDKLAITRLFITGVKDYKLHPEMLDTMSVLEYAHRHRVSEKAIVRILKPLSEGIFFMPIQTYSAFNFFGLFVPFLPRIAKAPHRCV